MATPKTKTIRDLKDSFLIEMEAIQSGSGDHKRANSIARLGSAAIRASLAERSAHVAKIKRPSLPHIPFLDDAAK